MANHMLELKSSQKLCRSVPLSFMDTLHLHYKTECVELCREQMPALRIA